MQVSFKGWKIAEKRKRKGIRRIALASMIDASNYKSVDVSLAGYEKGENVPNAVILMKIAIVLGCSIEEFFDIKEDCAEGDIVG